MHVYLPDASSEPPCLWTMTERVMLDPQDLGVLRDGEGEWVGRVMELDGSRIKTEWDEVPLTQPSGG